MIRIEDETASINLYEYDNPTEIKNNFKKGQIVIASLTMNNDFCYLETIEQAKEDKA